MRELTTIVFILLTVSCSSSYQYTKPDYAPTHNSGDTSKFVMYEDPPMAIQRVPAKYPADKKQAKVEGEVWLEVEIREDGSVGKIEILQSLDPGPDGLDEAAVDAVQQWKFKPAKTNGKPVACWVTFPVGFRLN